jgi:hypothetical protein
LAAKVTIFCRQIQNPFAHFSIFNPDRFLMLLMGLFYAASKKCKSTKSKDIFWIKKKHINLPTQKEKFYRK